MIDKVVIGWSENGAARHLGTFPSLWEADAALLRAFTSDPPPAGSAYDKTDFRVSWSDGQTHEGRLDASRELVVRGPRHGGMLRHHLLDYGRWLASDDYLRMFTGHMAGEELARARAWGEELLRRLADDARAHGAPHALRNAAHPPHAGPPIPLLPTAPDAVAWLAVAPSPPTLLPEPTARCGVLRDALRRQMSGPDTDWSDPRAHAFVNYFTQALHRDLGVVSARDAVAIWKRWGDAVRDFREHPEGVGHGPMAYRSFVIAHDLQRSLQKPGSVFESFCPWREFYFADQLDPEVGAGGAHRERWDIHAWSRP